MPSVLIVDDEAFARELLAEILQKEGYHTVTAASGREAILLAAKHVPDVILLDVCLPQVDGLQVLSALRRHPRLHRVPVLLLAAQPNRQHIQAAQKLQANGYLLKTAFSLSDLLGRIQRLCEACSQQTAVLVGTGAARPPDAETQPSATSDQTAAADAVATVGRIAQGTSRTTTSPPTPPSIAVQGAQDTRRALNSLQPIITKEQIIQLVNQGLELKPLAPVVQGVITATANMNCSADDVARELGFDQAMAIRILKLANTSMYARGRPVNDLKSAVSRIGVQEIRRIAMTMGALQCYEGRLAKILHPGTFWEHSIACGLIASAIARRRNPRPDERYFLWGLLHDVGRLTLLEHVPDKYAEVLDTADRLRVPLEKVEKQLFLIDHCEILRRALEHWRFPRDFIAPVVYHHHGADSLKNLAGGQFQEATIIAAADRIAHVLDIGDSGNGTLYPLDEWCDLLGFNRQWLIELRARIPEETKEVKYALMARSNGAEWQDGQKDGRENRIRSVRVLYRPCEKCVDAYEIFLDAVCMPTDEQPPNLGYIHVPDARQFSTAWREYRMAEDAAGVSALPLLIICGKGKIATERLTGNGRPRRAVVLRTPISVPTFMDTIHELMAPSPPEQLEATAGHEVSSHH